MRTKDIYHISPDDRPLPPHYEKYQKFLERTMVVPTKAPRETCASRIAKPAKNQDSAAPDPTSE
jgi:hypothetical protein